MLDSKEKIMKEALKELYEQWSNEIETNCSALVEGEYSNPYYVSIPEDWETSKLRIMIVGEEGYGTWGCGKSCGWNEQDPPYTIKDVENIQRYNAWAIKTYTEQNKTAFWRRFKKIMAFGYPCIWNNLDKIHSIIKRKRLKHKLTNVEKQLLHSTPTKVLKREIEILKPTIVVFFGWYYESLCKELPEICKLLYPKGKEDDSLWKNTVYQINKDNITYVFTYHPSWGYRTKGYEEKVMNDLINTVCKQEVKQSLLE